MKSNIEKMLESHEAINGLKEDSFLLKFEVIKEYCESKIDALCSREPGSDNPHYILGMIRAYREMQGIPQMLMDTALPSLSVNIQREQDRLRKLEYLEEP